jgi:hypothetical protein
MIRLNNLRFRHPSRLTQQFPPKAVEGHRAPKTPPFQTGDPTLWECAQSPAAFSIRPISPSNSPKSGGGPPRSKYPIFLRSFVAYGIRNGITP